MQEPEEFREMSDIIRLLPDSVANQIAAGEVIQRPASVVKELMENAIDAGATCIKVVLKDAGRTLIQVIDNGKGMSMTDARLSFERHATSKINKAEDLFSLKTMGFRGEALASIAAIAHIELRTKRNEDEIGTMIQISGSEVEKQDSIMCDNGSNFLVKNIFFNVPARRKFLKSNQTELSNIVTEFERIALVNPDLSFSLIHNDNEITNLISTNQRQRIINIFGKSLNQQLLSVDVNTSLINISGYIGRPEAARKKNALQYFFVNNRYMRHPYFNKAVTESYQQLIPQGEMPNYFLYLEVDPANIDVNIHPTKTEIKFENESYIWQIINAAVKEALGKFSAVPSIDFDMTDAPDIPVYNASSLHKPTPHFDTEYNPFKKNKDASVSNWQKLYQKNNEHKRTDPFKGNLPDFSEFKEDLSEFGTEQIEEIPQQISQFDSDPDYFHADAIFPSANPVSSDDDFSENEMTFVSKISSDENSEAGDETNDHNEDENENIFVSKISGNAGFENEDSEAENEGNEIILRSKMTDEFYSSSEDGSNETESNEAESPEAGFDNASAFVTTSEQTENNVFMSGISAPVKSQSGIFEEKSYSEGKHFQLKGRYILTSVKSGLMLIDQHRAHIRVLFDRYMENINNRQGVSQGILFPEMLEVSVSDAVILDEITEDLNFLGFDISNLGSGTYSVNGIPAGIEGINYTDLIHSMIDNAKNKGKNLSEEIHEMLSLTLAKAAAIPYGEFLNNDAMEKLIDSLFSSSMPNYTPDGKTIISVLSNEEILKRFR